MCIQCIGISAIYFRVLLLGTVNQMFMTFYQFSFISIHLFIILSFSTMFTLNINKTKQSSVSLSYTNCGIPILFYIHISHYILHNFNMTSKRVTKLHKRNEERLEHIISSYSTFNNNIPLDMVLKIVPVYHLEEMYHNIPTTLGTLMVLNISEGIYSWFKDYIYVNPAFPGYIFQRRFPIPRLLYYHIRDDVLQYINDYLKQRKN